MKQNISLLVAVTVMVICPVFYFQTHAAEVPARVMKLHQDAIVADLHADTQFMITYMGFDIGKRHRTVTWGPSGVAPMFSDLDVPRMKEGGLDLFNMAICPSPKTNKLPGLAGAFVNRSLSAIERMAAKNTGVLAVARSPREARDIIASGRIAVLLAVEGGSGIENNLDVLRQYYDRGVRYMTLTHAKNLDWAESATDKNIPEINGLTDFGRDVVREMEKMGMMIDLAHVSPETFWATLDAVDCPVIDTHAGARALADHPRNLSDDQIKAIAERGGVIGVIFHTGFLDPDNTKPHDVTLVADNIDYIKDLAGVDVIALGSDFDGSITTPPDLADASYLPNLTAELVRRGYSDDEIRKIMGENFLRTWEEIENYQQH